MNDAHPEYTNFEQPDLSKYSMNLAGFTMDLQRVWHMRRGKAIRRRVGSKGLYKPGFARLPDGSFMATPCMYLGTAEYVISIYRSTDDGLSWEHVADGPSGKEPTLLPLDNGDLILLTEETGRRGNEFSCWRSTDAGKTWTERELPGLTSTFPTRAVYQRDDGAVRILLSNGRPESGPAPRTAAWIFESRDNGVTWHKHADIETWDSIQTFCCEACVLPVSDDNLLMTVRVPGDFPSRAGAPADMPEMLYHEQGWYKDEAWNRMVMMASDDGGVTWSEPWPILERGNVHAHLLRLRDGRILATYAWYHLPWGVYAAVSEDEGRTFDTDSPTQLSNSLWVCLGWPTSVQLDDGSIITCYTKQAYWDDRSSMGERYDLACETVRWQLPW